MFYIPSFTMKTFFKWALILLLIYLCYWLYTWNINLVTIFTNINYLGDMWSSYSNINDSRFDVVNK